MVTLISTRSLLITKARYWFITLPIFYLCFYFYSTYRNNPHYLTFDFGFGCGYYMWLIFQNTTFVFVIAILCNASCPSVDVQTQWIVHASNLQWDYSTLPSLSLLLLYCAMHAVLPLMFPLMFKLKWIVCFKFTMGLLYLNIFIFLFMFIPWEWTALPNRGLVFHLTYFLK